MRSFTLYCRSLQVSLASGLAASGRFDFADLDGLDISPSPLRQFDWFLCPNGVTPFDAYERDRLNAGLRISTRIENLGSYWSESEAVLIKEGASAILYFAPGVREEAIQFLLTIYGADQGLAFAFQSVFAIKPDAPAPTASAWLSEGEPLFIRDVRVRPWLHKEADPIAAHRLSQDQTINPDSAD